MSRTIAATLTATVAAIALMSMATPAQAGCGGGGHYRPIHRPLPIHHPIHRPIYRPIVVEKPVVVHKPIVVHKPVILPITDTCQHPAHCYAWVCPGETLDAICLREYGDASLWPQVARYNGLTDILPTDRPLQLPSIHADGRMVPSTAPAPIRPLAAAPAALPPTIIPAAPSA